MKTLKELAEEIAIQAKERELRAREVVSLKDKITEELKQNKTAITISELVLQYNFVSYRPMFMIMKTLVDNGILNRAFSARIAYYYYAEYKQEFEKLLKAELDKSIQEMKEQ